MTVFYKYVDKIFYYNAVECDKCREQLFSPNKRFMLNSLLLNNLMYLPINIRGKVAFDGTRQRQCDNNANGSFLLISREITEFYSSFEYWNFLSRKVSPTYLLIILS